jgi:hypothetical protein
MEVVLVQPQRWRFLLVILIHHPSSQIIVPEVLSPSGLQSSLTMASQSCQQLPCWHVTLSMWCIFLKIQPKHQLKPPQNSMSPHFRGSSSKHVQNSPIFPELDGISWVQCRKKWYIYIYGYESKPWDPTVGTHFIVLIRGDSPSHMLVTWPMDRAFKAWSSSNKARSKSEGPCSQVSGINSLSRIL